MTSANTALLVGACVVAIGCGPGGPDVRSVEIDGQTLRYLVDDDGEVLVGGDMAMGSVDEFEAGLSERGIFGNYHASRTRRWPDGLVRYRFARRLPSTLRIRALEAMKIWSRVAPVRFERCNSVLCLRSHVRFRRWNKSYNTSKVGRILTPAQHLNLSSNASVGVIVHELGHALGLQHEHQRCDRDRHVQVRLDNVTRKFRYAFDKLCRRTRTHGRYDLASVMHYGAYAFSRNGQPTMTERGSDTPLGTDHSTTPSEGDIAAVRAMYAPSGRGVGGGGTVGGGSLVPSDRERDQR